MTITYPLGLTEPCTPDSAFDKLRESATYDAGIRSGGVTIRPEYSMVSFYERHPVTGEKSFVARLIGTEAELKPLVDKVHTFLAPILP